MSKVYEFAISRKLSVVLAICCALAAILLFVAGTMSGVLLAPRYAAYAQPKPKVEPAAATTGLLKPASPEQAQSGASATAPSSTATAQPRSTPPAMEVAPTVVPAAQPIPAAAPVSGGSAAKEVTAPAAGAGNSQSPQTGMSAAAGGAATANGGTPAEASAPAKPAAPPPPDPYAVSLVVQVGSFTVEANATRLAESLRQLGYPAEIVQRTDSHQRLWYVVRLGPYREWNAASGVAMRLAANQELKPIVGPM